MELFLFSVLRVAVLRYASHTATPCATSHPQASEKSEAFSFGEKMKKLCAFMIAAAMVFSTVAEAKGGRGFGGGRSFSRPAVSKTYAPKRTTVVQKNTTVINQTVNRSESSGGFWSTFFGSAAGSMAGNAVYDAVTDDEKKEAPVPQQ